jgi:hypothetical protein
LDQPQVLGGATTAGRTSTIADCRLLALLLQYWRAGAVVAEHLHGVRSRFWCIEASVHLICPFQPLPEATNIASKFLL